jgi:hypothetical protein
MLTPSNVLLYLSLYISTTLSLHISSLGSSYAAGPGLPPHSNYASLLSRRLSAMLTDLAVSGSTLLELPSQIAKMPLYTDIVTLTSGGNDIGYIGGLMTESFGEPAVKSSVTGAELLARFNKALESIHRRIPKAMIYLVDYPTVLGGDVKPGVDVPFNTSRVAYHRGVAKLLLDTTVHAAKGKIWVELIESAELSVRHGIGSAVPWVNGVEGVEGDGISWHPNKMGMEAIAQELYDKVKGSRF